MASKNAFYATPYCTILPFLMRLKIVIKWSYGVSNSRTPLDYFL